LVVGVVPQVLCLFGVGVQVEQLPIVEVSRGPGIVDSGPLRPLSR
jgi:hypothetical protein